MGNCQIKSELLQLNLPERLSSISKESVPEKSEINPLAKNIQKEVEYIFSRYQLLHKSDQDDVTNRWRRPLCVKLYHFQTSIAKGWPVHTVFYVMMIFVASIIFAELQSPSISPNTEESEMIYLLVGLIVLMGSFFLVLQRIAIRIRNSEAESSRANR